VYSVQCAQKGGLAPLDKNFRRAIAPLAPIVLWPLLTVSYTAYMCLLESKVPESGSQIG